MAEESRFQESQEFQVISSLSQPDVTVASTIQRLLSITLAAATEQAVQNNDALGTHLISTFGSIMDIAARTVPSSQTALVEFVRSLQQEKVVDPATGQHLRYEEDFNKTIWTEVPLFGVTVADDWGFDLSDPSPLPEEVKRHENQVAFLAQLTASSANSVPNPESEPGPFDFSLYALWDLRGAFENSETPQAPTLTYLRSVCYWLIYAADRLWANVRTERDFRQKEFNHNPAEEGEAYHKKKRWHGFNRERWNIWVKGFENARDDLDEESKKLVGDALKAIEKVMDQGWRIREPEKFA